MFLKINNWREKSQNVLTVYFVIVTLIHRVLHLLRMLEITSARFAEKNIWDMFRIMRMSERKKSMCSLQDQCASSVKAKSVKSKSVKAKSMNAKSVKAKSVKAKSVKAKSVKAKSVKAKSVKAKSVKAKSVKAKSVKAKSMKT